MKNFSLILTCLLLLSCEQDFESPNIQNHIVEMETNTTLDGITSNLSSYEENVVSFEEDLIIEAYVVSSDQAGNFYKELIIQDDPLNPTKGVALQINESNLYEHFPVGSKIYIQLNGLSIAYQNGVIELGVLNENEITQLSPFQIDEHLLLSHEIASITPKILDLSLVNENDLNKLVQVENVQFPNALFSSTPMTLANEVNDQFDALRPLKSCDNDIPIFISTSVYSSFKTHPISALSGNIKGILTKDYDNLHYIIKMNSIDDLQLNNEQRCDADFFSCEEILDENLPVIFHEDFNQVTNENQLDGSWINENITGDEVRWTDKKITNIDNRVLTISSYNSGLNPLHAWLVTPQINLNNYSNAFAEIKLRTLYNNGDALKIWVTENYNSSIQNTEWNLIEVDLPNTSSNYIDITINLDCMLGGDDIRIGLEYKGYDAILTSTYQINEVSFYAE